MAFVRGRWFVADHFGVLGGGGKVSISPAMDLNLGYFHTLFDRETKVESEILSTEYFKTSNIVQKRIADTPAILFPLCRHCHDCGNTPIYTGAKPPQTPAVLKCLSVFALCPCNLQIPGTAPVR
ncbi:MAG: hypothetical protein MJZ04_01785 [Bacteroidales bacterium]|nr:hypothetical protein [Bacteroidales bacterium]